MGNSAGGHFGIALNHFAYHFVFYPNKLFHIQRENYEDFLYKYTKLQNRTATVHKINLSEKNYKKILNHFDKNYLIIEKHKYNLKNISQNLSLLESLVYQKKFQIVSGGYFSDKQQNTKQNFNFNFNFQNVDKVKSEIRSLLPNLTNFQKIDINLINKEYFFIVDHSNFIRFQQNLDFLFLAEIFEKKKGLSQKTTFCSNIPLQKSNLHLFKNLSKLYQKKLNQQLKITDLAHNNIVNLARFLIIKKSLKLKQLCSLNVINEKSKYLVKTKLNPKEQKLFLKAIQKKIDDFQQKISAKKKLNFNDWSILERLLNYHHMVKTKKIFISNLEQKLFYPSKIGDFSYKIQIQEKKDIIHTMQYFKIISQEYSQKVKKLYRFNLFQENCSTEVFQNLKKIYSAKERKQIFGGNIESKFNFIPFVASYNLSKKYKKQKKTTINSYRKMKLKQIYQKSHQSKFFNYLKESNTLSSSLYKYNTNDGFFLFFTDDQIWTRPIYGIFNLSTSFVYTTYGFLKIPFDKGSTFKKGLLHSLYSFPELLFINIRKGSFPYLKKEQ